VRTRLVKQLVSLAPRKVQWPHRSIGRSVGGFSRMYGSAFHFLVRGCATLLHRFVVVVVDNVIAQSINKNPSFVIIVVVLNINHFNPSSRNTSLNTH
jgi:hypothetical protein